MTVKDLIKLLSMYEDDSRIIIGESAFNFDTVLIVIQSKNDNDYQEIQIPRM